MPFMLIALAAGAAILVPHAPDLPAAGVLGRWTATSTTAIGITGAVILSDRRMRLAGHILPFASATDQPRFRADGIAHRARVWKIAGKVNPVLLNGNRLCTGRVRWIAAYLDPDRSTLRLAAFEGRSAPVSVDEPGLCGTFLYSR